jgi:hypothetical protein
MRRYDASTPLTADIKKGVMGSIVLDTIVRGAGGGVPAPVNINFGGTNIRILGANPGGNAGGNTQALIQENSMLKAELNKAMRQMSGGNGQQGQSGQSGQIRVQEVRAPTPPPWPLESTMPVRHQHYGFMEGPIINKRQKDYGFAGDQVQSTDKIAKMFGML